MLRALRAFIGTDGHRHFLLGGLAGLSIAAGMQGNFAASFAYAMLALLYRQYVKDIRRLDAINTQMFTCWEQACTRRQTWIQEQYAHTN